MEEAGGQKGETGRQSPKEGAPFAAPTISLPKGGGAIRGIGEKFAANPVTGTGSMTVPITTSPDRSSFGPQLSLSYDSSVGNGSFSFGWSLSLLQIARKTNHVERPNCTLRRRVARLVRATVSFSQKLSRHIGAIRYLTCDDNLTRSATLSA